MGDLNNLNSHSKNPFGRRPHYEDNFKGERVLDIVKQQSVVDYPVDDTPKPPLYKPARYNNETERENAEINSKRQEQHNEEVGL